MNRFFRPLFIYPTLSHTYTILTFFRFILLSLALPRVFLPSQQLQVLSDFLFKFRFFASRIFLIDMFPLFVIPVNILFLLICDCHPRPNTLSSRCNKMKISDEPMKYSIEYSENSELLTNFHVRSIHRMNWAITQEEKTHKQMLAALSKTIRIRA